MERIKKRAMKKCGNDVIFTGFKENISRENDVKIVVKKK